MIESKKSFHSHRLKFSILLTLVRRDLISNNINSSLGLLWIFIFPVVYTSVIFIVFSSGLRKGATLDYEMPFILYLVLGMTVWTYFSSSLLQGQNVLRAYSFLLKKSGFPIEVVPWIKVFSNLVPHFAFLVIAFFIATLKGVPLHWTLIQIPIYTFCLSSFLYSVNLILSSLSLFIPDLKNLLPVLVQIGFWATPIFYSLDGMPRGVRFLLRLNPVTVIMNGYRNSFAGKWFFFQLEELFYFLSFTVVIFLVGKNIFNKSRGMFLESL